MKVLFIGTGVITYAHADGLKLIGSEPAACYDIFKPSAERFAKTYGCEALDDYKEYLDREKVDYALLCTPPGVRLEYMEEIMSRGIPLYVEKPIATNMEDAIKMQEMAEKYNVPIMVNFVHCPSEIRSMFSPTALDRAQASAAETWQLPGEPTRSSCVA